jgi:hypothetical protein
MYCTAIYLSIRKLHISITQIPTVRIAVKRTEDRNCISLFNAYNDLYFLFLLNQDIYISSVTKLRKVVN